MNCEEYQALDPKEKIQLVGKCVHLLQNDSDAFKAISSMVRNAEQLGAFEEIKIMPDSYAE